MQRSHGMVIDESELSGEPAPSALEEALRDDFAAKGFPTGHVLDLTLQDGRACSLRVHACPQAPGPRPVVFLDQVDFQAPSGRQARWPIEEAAFELLTACPWLHQQRARLVVHRPGSSPAGEATHGFYEIHCTVSHGHLIGYGSDPLGGPSQGYERIRTALGPHLHLADDHLLRHSPAA